MTRLVILMDEHRKGLLERTEINTILVPFHPVVTDEALYLDGKYIHYVNIDDHSPLKSIIDALLKVDGVESVYEKPLEFPPL